MRANDKHSNQNHEGEYMRQLQHKIDALDCPMTSALEADMYFKYQHDAKFQRSLDNTLSEVRIKNSQCL